MAQRTLFSSLLIILILSVVQTTSAQFPRFKVLAFYSKEVEPDHVEFAFEAIKFFRDLTSGNGFVFDTTQNKLIIAGLRWLVATDKKGDVFSK